MSKIKMYTHISIINLKGKVSNTKNVATALVYFCNYPYGTPCTMYMSGYFTFYIPLIDFRGSRCNISFTQTHITLLILCFEEKEGRPNAFSSHENKNDPFDMAN